MVGPCQQRGAIAKRKIKIITTVAMHQNQWCREKIKPLLPATKDSLPLGLKLRPRACLTFIVFFLCLFHTNMGFSDDKKITFSIPSQSADRSLIEFADQAGLTLIVPFDIIQRKTTHRLVGRHTLSDAIQILLFGTGLEATIETNGQLTITAVPDMSGAPAGHRQKPQERGRYDSESAGDLEASASVDSTQEIYGHSLSSPDGSAILEEVTVTARRRAESLQSVPDTIVAISGASAERANITAARDIAAKIPNVSLVESLSPTSTYIIVRGISSVRNSEPAVAVIIDGVQVGSASEVSQAYYDIERIELLKGPQGALYGRNALGGALLVTSRKPTQENEGKITAGFGENGLFELSGSVSGPIHESLLFRLSGSHKSFDGNIKNEYLSGTLGRSQAGVSGKSPGASYMDFEEIDGYRAQLLWTPNESTAVDYRYSQNNLESGAMWYHNVYRMESDPDETYEFPVNSNGNPTAIRTIDTHTLKIDFETDLGVITSVSNLTDTNERYGVAGETKGHDRTGNVLFFTEPFVNAFLDQLSNPIDQAFFEAALAQEAAGNFVGSDQYYDINTYSQEFAISGLLDHVLAYNAGIYYLKTDRSDTIRATWETPGGYPFDCVPTFEGGPVISDMSCNGLLYSTQNQQDNQAWAVYLSTDYELSDNLMLTAALRYDEDQREVTRIDGPTVDTGGLGVGNCDSELDPDNCARRGSKIKDTYSAYQPKVSLAYTPDSTLTVYGTYARGFRSGGFNASGALLTDTYRPETLDSYELGIKSTLLDRSLRANVSLFYQDYKNAQQFEFDGNVFVQSLYNIPKSKIGGLEASLEYAATERLTLSAALGLMDSEIVTFDKQILHRMESELHARILNTDKLEHATQAAFDRGFVGSKLPNFAHQTANFSFQHELPFGSGNALISRVDYTLTNDVFWWIDGVDQQESLGLFDASVSLAIGDDLELRAWCKNCGDVIYNSEYSPTERELFGGAAKDLAYRARGRVSGLKLRYSF